MSALGAVVIGRNEGNRLKVCLESLVGNLDRVVYVDSGSTDQSLTIARSLGVAVVELSMDVPFTAARARNAGFQALIAVAPHLQYVQFIDGDCEMLAGWTETGMGFLAAHSDVAIVSGRRRERYPDRSVYNRLCDFDWELPVGETRFCGGDAMMRVDAFQRVGGFRDSLIAGEEPELCERIRQAGWKVWRIDVPMTLHDAAITRFSQWWKRTMRGGYAYTEGAVLHGFGPTGHFLRQSRRILLWGIVLPMFILAGACYSPLLLLGVMIYPVQVCRLAICDKSSVSWRTRWIKAFFFTLARFPEAAGMLKFAFNHFGKRTAKLIEYK